MQRKLSLTDLPSEILQKITVEFLGLDSRAQFLRSNKSIYSMASSYCTILRNVYPESFKKNKRKIEELEDVSDEKAKDIFLESHRKEHAENLCDKSYNFEYPAPIERLQYLSILCKLGDLPALIKAQLSLYEIWHSSFSILLWAHNNTHFHVLDYYYGMFQHKYAEFGLKQIHLAILCFQDITPHLQSDNLNTIAQAPGPIDVFGESDSENLTPLMLAAKIGNAKAVKQLCEQPGLLINKQSKTGMTALDYAIRELHFDVAEYLASKNALLRTHKYLNSELHPKVMNFLFKQSPMVIEAMKLKYDYGLASKFLKNADTSQKCLVLAYLNDHPTYKPLRDFFYSYPLGDSNWERGIYALTALIIFSKDNPDRLISDIIENIPDKNIVLEYKAALKMITPSKLASYRHD